MLLYSFFSSLKFGIKSSWLTSLFFSVSDILIPMLFNLLLANITILLRFFFLFLVVFNNIFIILVDVESARLNLALSIPTCAPMTVANDAIKRLPLVTIKTIKHSK